MPLLVDPCLGRRILQKLLKLLNLWRWNCGRGRSLGAGRPSAGLKRDQEHSCPECTCPSPWLCRSHIPFQFGSLARYPKQTCLWTTIDDLAVRVHSLHAARICVIIGPCRRGSGGSNSNGSAGGSPSHPGIAHGRCRPANPRFRSADERTRRNGDTAPKQACATCQKCKRSTDH